MAPRPRHAAQRSQIAPVQNFFPLAAGAVIEEGMLGLAEHTGRDRVLGTRRDAGLARGGAPGTANPIDSHSPLGRSMCVGESSGDERQDRKSYGVGEPRPQLQKPPEVAVALRKSAKQDAKTRIDPFARIVVSTGPAGT